MVSIKHKFEYLENGEINIAAWLQQVKNAYHLEQTDLIEKACHFAQETGKGLTTFYGHPCFEKGLDMGNIILDLRLDQEAVAAAIMLSSVQHAKVPLETVTEKLGAAVAKLIQGVQQMDVTQQIQKGRDKTRDQIQIDRLRKLLLAMVSDIRVVLIKLAERTCIMRGIKNINPAQRKTIAEETRDIYAPLANRLGIGQLKWELEDTAFHYAEPEAYKEIAKFLAERREDREKRIHDTIKRLKENFNQSHIHAEISGRAKHIYSIYLKSKKKDVDYGNIYDFSAVRILVPTLEDCYSALSIVHNLWEHIPKEFDDYIATPKPNGYRSIHTAVTGPDGKHLEIQIRTTAMHEEAERGVAAHWMYKEAKKTVSTYEDKIAFLRQLLDWHREVADDKAEPDSVYNQILSDRVYVFTPEGEILDLPTGATPLDFAYYLHSELGNHCRGAKIKGHIVPLTYQLKTGDQVEVLTNPHANPSRDWLNSDFGYINTPRARAKVAHWFRGLDLTQHIENGRRILEREFPKLPPHMNIQKIATLLHFKNEEAFLAALGRGQTRPVQIAHLIEGEHEASKPSTPTLVPKKSVSRSSGMTIAGISDLLTRIGRCCKPIPGDRIVGFITQGRGVTIHKQTCNNVSHLFQEENNRLIEMTWDNKHLGSYYVDLQIKAQTKEHLLKEVTNFFSNAKINLVSFSSVQSRSKNFVIITLTIQINALTQLNTILSQLNHLPGILEARRMSNT